MQMQWARPMSRYLLPVAADLAFQPQSKKALESGVIHVALIAYLTLVRQSLVLSRTAYRFSPVNRLRQNTDCRVTTCWHLPPKWTVAPTKRFRPLLPTSAIQAEINSVMEIARALQRRSVRKIQPSLNWWRTLNKELINMTKACKTVCAEVNASSFTHDALVCGSSIAPDHVLLQMKENRLENWYFGADSMVRRTFLILCYLSPWKRKTKQG
jgi:hypothetical protein